jgi:hypothetical protein
MKAQMPMLWRAPSRCSSEAAAIGSSIAPMSLMGSDPGVAAVSVVRQLHPRIVAKVAGRTLLNINLKQSDRDVRALLNRCCAFVRDLESMSRDGMLKILLQQYLPRGDISFSVDQIDRAARAAPRCTAI